MPWATLFGDETGVFDLKFKSRPGHLSEANALPENGMVMDGTMLMAMNSLHTFGKSIENWKKPGAVCAELMVHDFYDSVAMIKGSSVQVDYVDKQTATTTKPPGHDREHIFPAEKRGASGRHGGPATYNMLTNYAGKKVRPHPPGLRSASTALARAKAPRW